MREDLIGLARMTHIFLDAKIIHRDIEVQRRRHGDRRQIRGTVAPRAHMINLSQGGDLLEMPQPSTVYYGHAEVVDQLFLDQKVRIPNRVEDFADREWRRRMPTNNAEALLQFRGHGIFQPE